MPIFNIVSNLVLRAQLYYVNNGWLESRYKKIDC